MYAQQVATEMVGPAPSTSARPAGPLQVPDGLKAVSSRCPPTASGEVVVCGRDDQEKFRLRALPDLPESKSILSTPLRLHLAQGVTLGAVEGGGLGVRIEFGPGKKSGSD
ncbi:hypothetical protein EV292_1181 [Sphingomonas sp. BK235]|nr:hypothetical protein EV292_1181 [Sphingomonas sp. BK235]